jgi:SAM-dependent methyltransferase
MCNKACLDFGKMNLTESDIRGKRIIEVGSRDVNGSMRQIVGDFAPAEYVGIDIENGPGVDQICDVYELVDRFGKESFDVVISTEMVEHVRNWRNAFSQLKQILKPNGILLITTRSKGFPYHDYPSDFWRFEIEDMQTIFSDLEIEALTRDTSDPGVLLKARKTNSFTENNLDEHALYSMISSKRTKDVSFIDILLFKIKGFFVK